MVSLTIQTLSGQRTAVEVDLSGPTGISALREKVATELKKEPGTFKLISGGVALVSPSDVARLGEGDTVLVAPQRKPPPQALRDLYDGGEQEAEADDLKLRLSDDAQPMVVAAVRFAREKLHVPEIILLWIFSVRPRVWAVLVCWLLGCPIAARFDLGPVYIVGSLIACIWLYGLRAAREGEVSAYSIFNPDCRELPGQLNAAALDGQLRRGQM